MDERVQVEACIRLLNDDDDNDDDDECDKMKSQCCEEAEL